MEDRKVLSFERLNEILTSTIDSIKNSQGEIIEIVNYSRDEYKKIVEELKTLQANIAHTIKETERLEVLAKKAEWTCRIRVKSIINFQKKK